MSVFKTLKGTFQNVQQDIVDGLRALTSLDSGPRHERYKQLRAEGISLDAGADFLYRYQKEWADIQNYTTESAKKAEEIDTIAGELFTRCQKQWTIASQLEEEAAMLPNILTTLNNIKQLIGSLQQDFQAVEEELDKLENIFEEQALKKEKASHMAQLAEYRKTKEAEAHHLKTKLWGMLKDRAKQIDAKKSLTLMERQEAFQDAFSSDMDYYRTHGRPDRLPSGTEFPKVSSLSDITIEEDRKALDEFLSSGEGETGDAGGAFIEDDYTTDYREKESEDFPELDVDITIDDDIDVAVVNRDHAIDKDTEHPQSEHPQSSSSANDAASKETHKEENDTCTTLKGDKTDVATAGSSGEHGGENPVQSKSGRENADEAAAAEKSEGST